MTAQPRARSVRRFQVRRAASPALEIAALPGRLHSTARLPEGWMAPEHPWLDAASQDPRFEHDLRNVLLASRDFDEFLARLVAEGFDLASDHPDTDPRHRAPASRLQHANAPDGALPVGAVWAIPGQLAALHWQPEPDACFFSHALVTAYAPAALPDLRAALEGSADFAGLGRALVARGYRLEPAA